MTVLLSIRDKLQKLAGFIGFGGQRTRKTSRGSAAGTAMADKDAAPRYGTLAPTRGPMIQAIRPEHAPHYCRWCRRLTRHYDGLAVSIPVAPEKIDARLAAGEYIVDGICGGCAEIVL